MKFKFIGDDDQATLYGFTFPKGEAVDVPDDYVAFSVNRRGPRNTPIREHTLAVDKLKGHPSFEVVTEAPKAAPKKKRTVKKKA